MPGGGTTRHLLLQPLPNFPRLLPHRTAQLDKHRLCRANQLWCGTDLAGFRQMIWSTWPARFARNEHRVIIVRKPVYGDDQEVVLAMHGLQWPRVLFSVDI